MRLRWLLFAFVALTIAFGIRTYEMRHQTSAICREVEELKSHVRPELFNLKATRLTLIDLGIDPYSAKGERLIKGAKQHRQRERAELAPRDC